MTSSEQRLLLWYRNDLRLQDHEPLYRAWQTGATIIPLYCFDPRQFGKTAFGFAKTGAFRAEFLRQSLSDLRRGLQGLGSDLLVYLGKPEEVIPELVQTLGITGVYFHREVTSEEVAVETALANYLRPLGVSLHSFWGHTLYHPEDLPFALAELPEIFTQFRKRVEANCSIRSPLPAPSRLPELPLVDWGIAAGEIPTLAALNLELPATDSRQKLIFVGGEKEAWKRLQHYIWQGDYLRVYKETRNGMLDPDHSSKFSPWLALGCISPRSIYAQVQAYELQRLKNDSTYWLVFELLWRDYFRCICTKHGNRVFYPSGLQGIKLSWRQDWPRFELWRQGQTGFPLVDANMRELTATGYMSNRGRQNVGSFLTKNLGIDWRMGAEWFESLLIDYDVCSNWGNWNYTAGVGNDARGFRWFNILKQSQDYDPDGTYVKHWLPELAQVPASKVHQPWKLLPVEQQRYSVRLGVDYPRPVVDLFQSAQAQEQIYNQVLRENARGGRGG